MNFTQLGGCCVRLGVSLGVLFCGSNAQAASRLLLCGPSVVGGTTYDAIHSFDLGGSVPQAPLDFASFAAHPNIMTLAPDGLIYVVVDTDHMIYKLNHTGVTVASIPVNLLDNENSVPGLVVLQNGHILLGREASQFSQRVVEFAPDGTTIGDWLPQTPGLDTIRNLTLTPSGTIAFTIHHPAYTATEIREYDASGAFLRIVVPTSEGLSTYSFVFSASDEILVTDRVSNKIKRYTWTTGSFIADFANAPGLSPNAFYIARDPSTGSVYGASGRTRCIYGWNANGSALFSGQELTCYNPGSGGLYPGSMLTLSALSSVPTTGDWGVIIMALLILMAGTLVYRSRVCVAVE